MKKIMRGFGYLLCGIIMILAMAFVIIEGRLLFSGDWLLYEFAAAGALRYGCRLIIALGIAALCASFFIKKRNQRMKEIQRETAMALVLIFIIAMLF